MSEANAAWFLGFWRSGRAVVHRRHGPTTGKAIGNLTIGSMRDQTPVDLRGGARPNTRKLRDQTPVDKSSHPKRLGMATSREATGGGLW